MTNVCNYFSSPLNHRYSLPFSRFCYFETTAIADAWVVV